MKIRWIPAFAVSLGTSGAPAAAPDAGDDETSGTDELRSTYERAVKLVEASDHDDALEVIGKLNRKESANPDVLNMLGLAHRGKRDTRNGQSRFRHEPAQGTPRFV